ncbi:MAG: cupredoxin domain-containing protein [Chloroflexota bacterium]|nr:cupredoxin domain-containing protein [Chloroflexota bacterium]MDP9473159.1 cupredoxin domain-containing protein [Chloroflexota bacterium]
MHRFVVVLAVFAVALGVAVGGYTMAQDLATPATDATPSDALCATPVDEAAGTPVATVSAPITAATPGGVEAGTPVGLFPCATPVDATPFSEAPAGTPAAGAVVPVVVEMVDIAFVPVELTIPANTDVPFRFVNNGAAVHNFTIDNPAVFSGDLAAGATSDLVVNLPAGTYEYYCSIPGHAQAGMVGTLAVT